MIFRYGDVHIFWKPRNLKIWQHACRCINSYALKWYEARRLKKSFGGSNFVQKFGHFQKVAISMRCSRAFLLFFLPKKCIFFKKYRNTVSYFSKKICIFRAQTEVRRTPLFFVTENLQVQFFVTSWRKKNIP